MRSEFAVVLAVFGFAITIFLSCADNPDLGEYPSIEEFFPKSSSGTVISSSSEPSSSSATNGTFTDTRGDKKIYKWVKIGNQIWMAENLNYNESGSKCYGNIETNCITYGKMYNWATAKIVCPSGWHLPTKNEWEVLTTAVGGYLTEGKYLKATSGWKNLGNGEDTYGFAALPGGSGLSNGVSFGGLGEYGDWWSDSEYNTNNAYYLCMHYDSERADLYNEDKSNLRNVRCLKN